MDLAALIQPPLGPRDLALAVLLSAAVVTDLRSQKIYNVLTFPMTLLGILSAIPLCASPWAGLAGAGVALIASLPAEIFKAMRMGDVKLLMAVGALTGPDMALRAVLFSLAMNLVYGVAILAYKGRLRRLVQFLGPGEKPEPTVVAYAPAIAMAVLLVRLQPWPQIISF